MSDESRSLERNPDGKQVGSLNYEGEDGGVSANLSMLTERPN